jgi:hypothetical protein
LFFFVTNFDPTPQYDSEDYPTYDYNGEYDGSAAPAPTQQTDYGQYYDYDYDGVAR